MTIIHNGVNISKIYHGTTSVSKVYKGSTLIWEETSPTPPSPPQPSGDLIEITQNGKGLILKQGLEYTTMDWSGEEPVEVTATLDNDITISSVTQNIQSTETDEQTGITTELYYQPAMSYRAIVPVAASVWGNPGGTYSFTMTAENSLKVFTDNTKITFPNITGNPISSKYPIYLGAAFNKSDIITNPDDTTNNIYAQIKLYERQYLSGGGTLYGKIDTTLFETSDNAYATTITTGSKTTTNLSGSYTSSGDLEANVSYTGYFTPKGNNSNYVYLLWKVERYNMNGSCYLRGISVPSVKQYVPVTDTTIYLSLDVMSMGTECYVQIMANTQVYGNPIASYKVDSNGDIYDLTLLNS